MVSMKAFITESKPVTVYFSLGEKGKLPENSPSLLKGEKVIQCNGIRERRRYSSKSKIVIDWNELDQAVSKFEITSSKSAHEFIGACDIFYCTKVSPVWRRITKSVLAGYIPEISKTKSKYCINQTFHLTIQIEIEIIYERMPEEIKEYFGWNVDLNSAPQISRSNAAPSSASSSVKSPDRSVHSSSQEKMPNDNVDPTDLRSSASCYKPSLSINLPSSSDIPSTQAEIHSSSTSIPISSDTTFSTSAALEREVRIPPNRTVIVFELDDTIINFLENETLKDSFGRSAACQNLELLLVQVCQKHLKTFCLARTSSQFVSSFFGFEEIESVTELSKILDISRKMICIADKAIPENYVRDNAWVQIDFQQMLTNAEYWAGFSELRSHLEMLLALIENGMDISHIAPFFLAAKKICGQALLNPPNVYLAIEHVTEFTTKDFEIGSRVLEMELDGQIRLGRYRGTGDEVLIKVQNTMMGKESIKDANWLRRELKYYQRINNSIPGLGNSIPTGSKLLMRFPYDYVNDSHTTNESSLNSFTFPDSAHPTIHETLTVVMEDLRVSLATILQPEYQIQFTPDILQTLMIQMFDSVWQVHKFDIVLRDIRLTRFMYDFKTNRIKLTDFGASEDIKDVKSFRARPMRTDITYRSFNSVGGDTFTKGDDLESLALCYCHLATKKEPITEELKQMPMTSHGDLYKLLVGRREFFQKDGTTILDKVIFPFYNTIRQFNDYTVRDVVPYEKLRLLLTSNGFREDLPEGWISKRVFQPQVLQPEKDMMQCPLRGFTPTELQKISTAKFEAEFGNTIGNETIRILIDLNILCTTSDVNGDIVLQSNSDAKTYLNLAPRTDVFLASACSFMRCCLLTDLGIVDAHLIHRFPMFKHYFGELFWNDHVKNVDRALNIDDNADAETLKFVLIQNKNGQFNVHESVQVITHVGESLDELVNPLYAAVKRQLSAADMIQEEQLNTAENSTDARVA